MMLPFGDGSRSRPVVKAKPLSRIGKIFADGRRIDEAVRLAARDAIRKHAQHDAPLLIWRDGGPAWVPARELLKASRKTTGKTRRIRPGR